MKVLITGGRGFIGSHLANRLSTLGHKVKVLDNLSHPSQVALRSNIQFVYGDIRYPGDVNELVKWSDWVLHLAAQIHVDKSISNPEETIDTNVKGTLHVLEAVRRYKKKMIFASTSEVYGTSQTGIMDEQHPLDAQSPYGASKVSGDRLCKAYFDTYDTHVIILRNFNTYGPGQADGGEGSSYGAVLGIFTRLALEDKSLPIFGTGEQSRDYMYIDDAVDAYLTLMNKGKPGEVYNAGTGYDIAIKRIPKILSSVLGHKVHDFHISARPGEVRRLKADARKLRELGWSPKVKFEDGMRKFVESYKQSITINGDTYDPVS